MKRAGVDADQLHAERMANARAELQGWGRWVMQRTDGGLGYGQGTLANLQRVAQSAEGYRAPILEVRASEIDDAINSLEHQVRVQARLHFGGQFSYAFIARQHRCAPATVSRNVELVVRTVAYWGHVQSPKLGSYAM